MKKMRINTEPVKEWFGYTRQERRSATVLLILIAVVMLFRMLIPGSKLVITDLTPELGSSLNQDLVAGERLFFDPNLASVDTLLMAGLDEHEAANLINYRSRGGRFDKPEDIMRLYSLDSAKASALIPHIIIGSGDTIVQEYGTELNRADSASLEKLPGLGPVLSARIIKYRNLLGGFVSVNQLKEVYGLNDQTFMILRSLVTVDTTALRKIRINSAAWSDLARMPYLSRYQVNAILKYREIAGSIKSIEELRSNLILPDSTAGKIRPYIDFSEND